MSSCLTSVSDGEVAKPLRLQRYTKKNDIRKFVCHFYEFLYFLTGFFSPLFYAVGASVRPVLCFQYMLAFYVF